MIIYFDNPNHEKLPIDDLGRNLAPLSKVFLYVSMRIEEQQRRNTLPWIVLRNILAYRNRIMRFLSEDFNGDIMEKHAISTQQDDILTHERAASHAATTDERGVLQVFGLGNVSRLSELTYPIELEEKTVINNLPENKINEEGRIINSYKSAELWLLLKNYVNGQIARLFNRCFNADNDKLESEAGIPALYVSTENEQEKNIFKKRLKYFYELCLKSDNRFLFLERIIDMRLHSNLDNAELFSTNQGKYYNAEYMRCIILDIILTAVKFATTDESFLPRVNKLMKYRDRERTAASVKSRILLFKDGGDLIILNNVKENMMDFRGVSVVNEEIYRRTHDPLDYGDGHMSLFTIRQFILRIRGSLSSTSPDTSFKYVTNDEVRDPKRYIDTNTITNVISEFHEALSEDKFWFETRLPILKEGSQNG